MKSNFSQHQQYIQGKVQNVNNQQRRSKSNKKQGGSLEPRQGSNILDQNKPGANTALNDQMTIEKMIQINNQYYYQNINAQQRGVPVQANQSNIFGQVNGQSNTNFNNLREDHINISNKVSQGQIGNHQVSLDANKQIKQGQIQEVNGLKKNLLNAGIGSQSINRRKHSSVQRNHMTEKQTYLMEKFVQTPIITQLGDNINQNQFLAQTQNVGVKSNIEGGGSGGSGSQNNNRNLIQQANILPQNGFSNKDSNKQNLVQIATQNHAKIMNSKKQIHQQIVVNAGMNQNQVPFHQNISNLKNRPPQDFMQMQLNKNQISRQEIHQNNMNQGSTTAKMDSNQQFQNIPKQLNSVSSNEIQQKQQLTYNQSPLIQQQTYNTGNMQGLNKINALNNYLINQQSDFNINQQGFNQNFITKNSNVKNGQSTILQTMISQGSSLTGAHQKNKMSTIVNGNQEIMTLHTKNSSYQIQKQAASEMKFKQEQSLFLDQSLAQNQIKVVPRNQNLITQTQIVQNLKSNGQRQSSKLRKNVSNVRNPVMQNATQQNGQRVSQQRRFNNTTLDNYQQQINQYNQNFNLSIVQPAETIQYDAQNTQNIQIQQALGTLQRGNQSRSVLRQNQQLKQYRNNYLPSNNYTQNAGSNTAMATIQNQEIHQKENGNQMKIKNQQIINRNEISNRAQQFVVTVQQIKQPQVSRANHSLKQQENMPEAQSESEQSNTIHRQYLVEGPTDGRLSSLDQESSQINQGSAVKGLHLRRNQPHNFSNISEKSSLMGDYGGTHTTHNNNQITVQGRQAGSNSAVNSANSQMPTVLNATILEDQQKVQNQFFAHRNTNIHQTVQQNQGNTIIKQGSKILGKSMNKSRGQLIRGATPQQQTDLLSENLIINNKNQKNNEFQHRRGSLPEGLTSEPDQRSYLQQFQTMDQNNQQNRVINKKTPEQQKQNFVDNNQQKQNAVQNKFQTIQGKATVQNNQNLKQQSTLIPENQNIQQIQSKKSESQVNRNKAIQYKNPQADLLQQNQENQQRKIENSKIKQANQEKNEFGFVIDPTIIKCVIEDTIEINQNPDTHIKSKNQIISQPISKIESQQRKQIKLIQIKKNNGTDCDIQEIDNTVVNIFSDEKAHNLGFCDDDLMEEGEDINITNNEDVGEEGFEIVESMQQTVSQKYDNIERSESQQLSQAVSGNLGQKIISTPAIIVPSPYVQEANQIHTAKNSKLISQNNVVMNKNFLLKEIGNKDQIVIKNNNIFLNADDVNDLDANMEPIAQFLPAPVNAKKNTTCIEPFPKLNTQKIVIQDDSIAEKTMMKENVTKNLDKKQEQKKEEEQKKIVNYETFESSSEDEFSCGAFESAAASFQNKEKGAEQNLADIQEQKRMEKQRRKERKALEKKKVRAEQDRQERKNLRKKYRLQSVGIEQYDEYQDDVINFKDSQRDSVLSYFEGDIGLGIEIVDIKKSKSKGQKKNQYNDDFFFKKNLIDTPTRLINFSNEFLPKKKKINPDKLKEKKNLETGKLLQILNFKDLEMLSDIEKSQKSTQRKAEDEKRGNLINIFGKSEIEKLKNDIKNQLDKKADEKQYHLQSQSKSQGNKMLQNQKQTINNFQVNQQAKQLQEFKYKIKSNVNKR